MFWLFVTGGLVWLGAKVVGSQEYRNAVHHCYVARHRIRERKQKGIPTFGAEQVVTTFLAVEEERRGAVVKAKAYLMYLRCELDARKKHLLRALCGRRKEMPANSENLNGRTQTKSLPNNQKNNSMSDCSSSDEETDDEMDAPTTTPIPTPTPGTSDVSSESNESNECERLSTGS